jgi:YWFCY protein/Type IV secretory system Conjugative DNA transfer
MHTGENEQGLKKIIDMTRMISIAILLLHFYHSCYQAFLGWQLSSRLTDQLLSNIAAMGLLKGFIKTKLISVGLLLISLLGVKGRKSVKLRYRKAVSVLLVGVLLYICSGLILLHSGANMAVTAVLYMSATSLGYVLILTGGGLLTRIIKNKLNADVFNKSNETFPQEERLLENEYSINLPAQYNLRGKRRSSWINIINPMRGLLVIGSPGSGKSYFVIEHVIRQHMRKGFCMFIYDFKYDDLSRLAYNQYLKHRSNYAIAPSFYVINLDSPEYGHRCNPLDPSNMHDITDAVEAARIIMLGLNRSWLKKQGEFFVESPINFLTALIWFLRRYDDGAYCTLPHVIELMQVEMKKLFNVLSTEPEIAAFINPFLSAYETKSMEQLEGQLDAAKIGIARLSSPTLYYALSGHDFSLDINNPASPKIVCLANNPQKQEVYGPVLSLYTTRMTKIINRKNQLKTSLVIDEFTTLTFLGIDTLIATARSNKIATTIAIQDSSQLKLNYGREMADVILNICGNLVVGQVGGEMAKQASERLGKTLQDRESLSINSSDTSISQSKQLEMAVPLSTIASLSAGEFVGMVADNPEQPIAQKIFHGNIINNHHALQKEKDAQLPLALVRQLRANEVATNYQLIKQDIKDIVDAVLNDGAANGNDEGLIIDED